MTMVPKAIPIRIPHTSPSSTRYLTIPLDSSSSLSIVLRSSFPASLVGRQSVNLFSVGNKAYSFPYV
jgi:hypothetical protein